MKKARVNSRINNVKGKSSNSFITKKQGYHKVDRNKAVGYCMFHSMYVDKVRLEAKKCDACERFIKLIKKNKNLSK